MTCAACGRISCGHSDPVYAGVSPSPAAASPNDSSRPLAGGQPPMATGGFVAQPLHERTPA